MTTTVRHRPFKVETLPAEAKAWVDEQLVKSLDKLTYEQIAQHVEATWGVELHASSIHRYKKSFEHQKEKMAYLLSRASGIVQQVNGAGIELGETAQAMVVGDITSILAEGGHDIESLNKLGRTLALLGRLAVQQAEAKVRHGKAFKAFERRICDRLRAEVAADGELARRLEAIVADEAESASSALGGGEEAA